MNSSRILRNLLFRKNSNLFSFDSYSGYCHRDFRLIPSQQRSIFSTTHLQNSWIDKVKGVFTGKKASQDEPQPQPQPQPQLSSQSFSLLNFAEALKNARRVGTFKQFMVGRSSEATFTDAFEKMERIIRYLGGVDPSGENLQTIHKQEAAKQCNCTIADVENALAKFTWAKEAQKKVETLQKEGKPIPKSVGEMQKLMGSSPLDLAKSNLAKSGQISRNALCPCGSKKRYKWCCGKNEPLKNKI